jgi:hypothetical protein
MLSTLGGKMKKWLLLSSLALSSALFAASPIPLEQQISSFSVQEVSSDHFYKMGIGLGGGEKGISRGNDGGETGFPGGSNGGGDVPTKPTIDSRIQTAGRIIQTGRDMAAFGEGIYQLVKKGKPTNVTEYAPISVVPRNSLTKEIADVFDLEGFSMPVERNFVANVKNGSGKEVINFAYKVVYSYGGSYNGTGKYLTNILVVPSSIKTSFGWEFNATMKLSGIMNHGTKADPIAGVIVTLKYQMNSWASAYERNDTIHITGRGEVKNLSVE